MPIHKLSEHDARKFIAEQHAKYYEVLHDFTRDVVGKIAPPIPQFVVVDSVFRHCGMYDPATHTVQYSLAYCVYAGLQYDLIVAHEVVHAMQDKIFPGKPPHGSDFLWLLRDVCRFPDAGTTHSYPISTVEKVAEELISARGGQRNDLTYRAGSLRAMISQLNKRK